MLVLIPDGTVNYVRLDDFNTSHVSVNQKQLQINYRSIPISIHLMLVLIIKHSINSVVINLISIHLMLVLIAYTITLFPLNCAISIHLMLVLIIAALAALGLGI